MTTTYSGAIDEMFGAFNEAWKAGAAAVVGYVPEIRWQGVEQQSEPDASKFWARVSSQVVLTEQSTIANPSKRYTTAGLVLVQLFCPKKVVNAVQLGRSLAELARTVFRSATANVWFRNAKIVDSIPPEESYYRFNVVAEYEYDETVN